MTRTNGILLVSFLLTFAAGVALGVFAAGVNNPRHRSWLTEELNLSADQRERMRKIWSEVMEPASRQRGEQRAALALERDLAIFALLTDDQFAEYEAIQQDYARKVEDLSQERRKAFEEAVERTKKILTPEQAAKYDELMKKQRERGIGGPSGFRGPRDRRTPPDKSTEPPADKSTPRSGE